ncbi:hypothetical protein VTN77DRAFT_7526 [Rasamsonia byssochlamydoides]|uniref:uncharacterized protein n=1 Tax=Rasamsonia byssochlamydoides TaxID=89139 RepID=UPI0037426CFE
MSAEMRRRLASGKLKDGASGSDIGGGNEDDRGQPSFSTTHSSLSSVVDVGDMQIIGERSIGHTGISYDTGGSIFEPRDIAADQVQTVTTVVATVINIVVESGSRTIAEYTVPTLPAVVSDPALGLVTIPADTTSPITVTHEEWVETPSGSQSSPSTLSTRTPLTSETSQTHVTTPPSTTQTQPSSTSSTPSTSSASSSSTSPTSIISSFTLSLSSTSPTPTRTPTPTTSSSSIPSSSSASSSNSVGTGGAPSNGINATPSATAQSGSSGLSGGNGINTPEVIGGVVGGVGGAFLLLLLALLFLRWKKKRVRKTRGVIGTESSSRSVEPGQGSRSRSAEMASQRSSNTPLAAAGLFGRWRPSSPPATVEESTPSERGFQKISGRKIPSVLHTGGDGYGDEVGEESVSVIPEVITPTTSSAPPPGPSSPTLAQGPLSSSAGPYGGPAASSARESGEGEGVVVMRPSPARTPVASSANLAVPAGQSTQPGLAPPVRPDALGRSLSKYDGSRGSRFTESI